MIFSTMTNGQTLPPMPGLSDSERYLRDNFAGIALGAMMGNNDKDSSLRGKKGVHLLATYAYEYADAMMEARKK